MMAQALRITYPAALYHITSRGNEGNNIFNWTFSTDSLELIKE